MPQRPIDPNLLIELLQRAGSEATQPATLFLFGGAAIQLLGGSRATVDVDYLLRADDHQGLTDVLQRLAGAQNIDLEESIPDEFIPGPSQSETRHYFVGQYGLLRVFVLDPYHMAIMKIDRGLPTDLEDVRFLVDRGIVRLDDLEPMVAESERQADEPQAFSRHWTTFRRHLT
ncbi:MAG: hypothetical protein JNL73_12680 [Anaerolineales bacterium]|nr:hypothetical protein [Anaerolineales bacterium]